MLVRGRPGDTLPAKHDELTAVARLLGYKPFAAAPFAYSGPAAGPPAHHASGDGAAAAAGFAWSDTPAQALEQDYRRTARRARAIMDRLFYG